MRAMRVALSFGRCADGLPQADAACLWRRGRGPVPGRGPLGRVGRGLGEGSESVGQRREKLDTERVNGKCMAKQSEAGGQPPLGLSCCACVAYPLCAGAKRRPRNARDARRSAAGVPEQGKRGTKPQAVPLAKTAAELCGVGEVTCEGHWPAASQASPPGPWEGWRVPDGAVEEHGPGSSGAKQNSGLQQRSASPWAKG